jgi:Holliday junction resolvasome RuvABC endonuclease subunit
MIILGVDPGIAGAYAAIESSASGPTAIGDLPVFAVSHGKGSRGELDVSELVHLIARLSPDHVFVEEVHAMPKQGVTSTFRFGWSCGAIYAAVVALGRPLSLVRPIDWQRYHHVGKGPDDARRVAVRLFPDHAQAFARKKDNHRADAVLIALFGRYMLAQQQPKAA